MARYLLDTNVLLSSLRRGSAQREEAKRAVQKLLQAGDDLLVTPQVLIEFWSVATRPAEANGMGLEPSFVGRYVERIGLRFPELPDVKDVFKNWLALVKTHERRGKQVHDARLVAVMLTHGVENLLTFNADDFGRYQEIKAVHPADVK